MKRIALMLALVLALAPACLAEGSSADRFVSSLSETWNAFVDMARDAGDDVARWAEDSGVAEWAQGAADDIAAWAQENGLTDWAQNTADALSAWFDESGLKEWASDTAGEFTAFVEENRPAIEAWLAGAGEEVRHAWDTLTNSGDHTAEEVQQAYETVAESLEAAGGETPEAPDGQPAGH